MKARKADPPPVEWQGAEGGLSVEERLARLSDYGLPDSLEPLVQYDQLPGDEILAEAMAFGSAAHRILTNLDATERDRFRAALVLMALLQDARDPALARQLAWPWIRELMRP